MKTKIKIRMLAFLGSVSVIVGLLFFYQINKAQAENNSNKPNIHINVKKQTDDKGNITRYDSTYSYSWSSDGKNAAEIDSIMRSINEDFSNNSFNFEPFFGTRHFYITDSSMFNYNNFFDADSMFFDKGFFNFNNGVFKEMDEIMRQYEAITGKFFRNFPFKNNPGFYFPNDSFPSFPQHKAMPKKQNFNYGTTI